VVGIMVVDGKLEGSMIGLVVETGIMVGCRVVAKLGEIEGLTCGLSFCVGMLEGTLVIFTVGIEEGV